MPKQTFLNLPGDKRQWIIDCAVGEFAAHGYSGASVSRIVARAKIAKGSFYQYFENKEDLYDYVIYQALISRKLRITTEESVKLKDITLHEFLRMLFKHIMREFSGKPDLLKISLDFVRNLCEPVQARISEKYRHLRGSYYQQFIRDEKSRNEIDADVDDDMLGYMLMGATNEITNLILEKGHSAFSDEYIDCWIDRLEYILTNGIYKNTSHNEKEG